MNEIMEGEATRRRSAASSWRSALKGETADEIAGCAEAMRAHVARACGRSATTSSTPPARAATAASTINISTAAALVAAAAGAGSRSTATARSRRRPASADVLEALGFRLELPPAGIERSIDELGFGFLFAPTHHPAMRHAAPVRRELAARTVFNVLGP